MLDSYSVNKISAPSEEMSSARAEAIEALTALGYSSTDAMRAVRESGADKDADTETIIKLAFKQLSR
jgi:Holliday junction DNA helicase RuvA